MRRLAAALLALAPLAGAKEAPLALDQEVRHPAGSFVFRVPADWKVGPLSERVIEAGAGDLSVRFVWQKSEFGTDVAHTDCMTEQPVAGLPGVPRVSFEYDFMGGVVGDRRLLDSASHLDYEAPVKGHKSWRQRAVTIVGGGETLCAVSFAPRSAKKETRRLLDAILTSLIFLPPAKR